MFNIEQAAKALCISMSTIRRMICDGRLKAVMLGRGWKVSQEEIERIKQVGTR